MKQRLIWVVLPALRQQAAELAEAYRVHESERGIGHWWARRRAARRWCEVMSKAESVVDSVRQAIRSNPSHLDSLTDEELQVLVNCATSFPLPAEGVQDARLARKLGQARARIGAGLRDVVDAFVVNTEVGMEAALNKAVQAVRAAEAAGRLSPDVRSDTDLKESIKRMWEADVEEPRD